MRIPALCALLLGTSGCFLKLPPVVAPVPTGEAALAAPAAVNYGELEQRVDVMLGETEDADKRDRLVQLRELMYAMRGQDPTAQAKVYRYITAAVTIEERSRVIQMPLEDFGIGAPVIEGTAVIDVGTPAVAPVAPAPVAPVPVAPAPVSPVAPIPGGTAPVPVLSPDPAAAPTPTATSVDRASVLDATRNALAKGDYRGAISMVGPLADAEAKMLRQEAVDGLARTERERAGAMFLAAKALPAGEARTQGLRDAATVLRAVNATYPDNAFARQIGENLQTIEAELAGVPG